MRLYKKYKIIGKCQYYGTFHGIIIDNQINYLIFVNVHNETVKLDIPSKLFVSTCNFCEFVSQKARIQSDMEMRAVNLVLRKITGDKYFKW